MLLKPVTFTIISILHLSLFAILQPLHPCLRLCWLDTDVLQDDKTGGGFLIPVLHHFGAKSS